MVKVLVINELTHFQGLSFSGGFVCGDLLTCWMLSSWSGSGTPEQNTQNQMNSCGQQSPHSQTKRQKFVNVTKSVWGHGSKQTIFQKPDQVQTIYITPYPYISQQSQKDGTKSGHLAIYIYVYSYLSVFCAIFIYVSLYLCL